MNTKKFINAFYQLFDVESNYYQEAVKSYKDKKLFTNFITERLKEIINEYQVSTEYYRIDVSGWTQLREDNDKYLNKNDDFKLKTYLWNFDIAIEHENDSQAWMDEVVKLLHIRCPLRVVIGYMPYDKREEDLYYLNQVFERIKTIRVFDQNDFVNDEYIVILGNSKCKGKTDRFFKYKSYRLTSDGFIEYI